MKTLAIILLILISLMLSCSSDSVTSPTKQLTVVTSMGNRISMEGVWAVSCVSVGTVFVSEQFSFSEDTFTIDILVYNTASCDGTAIDTEMITVNFEVGETYSVMLAGQTVTANRISGTEFSNNNGVGSPIKQAFYIDDSQTPVKFYHGIFGEDGGMVDSQGYPLELHPIAIEKQ